MLSTFLRLEKWDKSTSIIRLIAKHHHVVIGAWHTSIHSGHSDNATFVAVAIVVSVHINMPRRREVANIQSKVRTLHAVTGRLWNRNTLRMPRNRHLPHLRQQVHRDLDYRIQFNQTGSLRLIFPPLKSFQTSTSSWKTFGRCFTNESSNVIPGIMRRMERHKFRHVFLWCLYLLVEFFCHRKLAPPTQAAPYRYSLLSCLMFSWTRSVHYRWKNGPGRCLMSTMQ